MSKSSSYTSEEEIIKKIIDSMGIQEYDPLLVSALSEYARSKMQFLFEE